MLWGLTGRFLCSFILVFAAQLFFLHKVWRRIVGLCNMNMHCYCQEVSTDIHLLLIDMRVGKKYMYDWILKFVFIPNNIFLRFWDSWIKNSKISELASKVKTHRDNFNKEGIRNWINLLHLMVLWYNRIFSEKCYNECVFLLNVNNVHVQTLHILFYLYIFL